jgi:hypothetical protein
MILKQEDKFKNMLDFEKLDKDFAEAHLLLPNPLDILTSLIQKEDIKITNARQLLYSIIVPESIWNKLPRKTDIGKKPLQVDTSIVWGASKNNIAIYGLKFFFQNSNKILIAIEGLIQKLDRKYSNPNFKEDKNLIIGFYPGINISKNRPEFKDIDFNFIEPKVTILGGYSTGYGGLNQTINNELIELNHLERIIYFDCIYRADNPQGTQPIQLHKKETEQGTDEYDFIKDAKGNPTSKRDWLISHKNSPYNTRRAITKAEEKVEERKAKSIKDKDTSLTQLKKEKVDIDKLPYSTENDLKMKKINDDIKLMEQEIDALKKQKLEVVGYAVTNSGSPKYIYKNTNSIRYGGYAVYVDILVDLRNKDLNTDGDQKNKEEESFLLALACARILKFRLDAKQITQAQLPQKVLQLIQQIPKRGEILSSSIVKDKFKKVNLMTLKEWGDKNKDIILSKDGVIANIPMVLGKPWFYSGYPKTNSDLLHLGQFLEFAGEFLL